MMTAVIQIKVKCWIYISLLLMKDVFAQDSFESVFGPDGRCFEYAADYSGYPQRSFADSRAHCQSLGGDLVVINDPMENNIIKTQIFTGMGFDFWLGMTFDGGSWVWWDASSTYFTDFTSEARHDPGADCTVANPDANWADGFWRRAVCSGFMRDTVCELTCNDTTPMPGYSTTTTTTAPPTTTTTTTTTTAAPTTTTTTTQATTTVEPTTAEATTVQPSTIPVTTVPPTTTTTDFISMVTTGHTYTTGDCQCTCGGSTASAAPHQSEAPVIPFNFTFFPMEEISWNIWLPWSSCTLSCGAGVQVRWRLCNDLSNDCDRKIEQTGPNLAQTCVSGYSLDGQSCNEEPCPTYGFWYAWTSWSSCSASCDYGTKSKTRACVKPHPDSVECEGKQVTHERCFIEDCTDEYKPIVPEEVDGGVMYKESDKRASAQAVGTLGIVILAITGALLLFCDIFSVRPKAGHMKPKGPPR